MNMVELIAYIHEDWRLHFPSGLFAELTEGHGCVGLNPNSLKTSGYDVCGGSPGSPNYLTDNDMVALANMMIAGWKRVRDMYCSEGPEVENREDEGSFW